MCLRISQKSKTNGVNDFLEMLFLEFSSTLMKVHLSRDIKCMSDVLSPAKESKVKQSNKNFNVRMNILRCVC